MRVIPGTGSLDTAQGRVGPPTSWAALAVGTVHLHHSRHLRAGLWVKAGVGVKGELPLLTRLTDLEQGAN